MPRKPSGKAKKQKLSKEERSQIAKDRWVKIKAAKSAQDENLVETITEVTITDDGKEPVIHTEMRPAAPVVEQDKISVEPSGNEGTGLTVDFVPTVAAAPQLAPVKAPKPKRYQGPKEFSVALKAAENRLAKAINERAEAMGKLAGLNAEIPSLLQIIQALKGSNNLPPAQYDFSGSVPNAQAFQAPIDPQAALMAAMAAPPVSRASGGAIQFSPDVVGSLEGPDDDPDKFITGPHAGGGWIGA